MQKIEITEDLFGILYPFVADDNVTDIKWNGRTLWINDLKKGRFTAKDASGKDIVLDDGWINIFTTRMANAMNVNFNMASPSLQAETDELRIHAVHKFVAGEEKYALAIRKTPSVSRLAGLNLIEEGYVDELTDAIMPAMIRARMSGCVIGDVGAGKTELEKYLCSFIPEVDGIITVEDTLEMKLPRLYPKKDIYSLKVSDSYTSVDAIRDALRLLTKWLILSEARGREIVQVMEAASTGCVAMTSVHAENVWEIPDRMINMAGGESREGFENDIYTFFDYAIKVRAIVTSHGIFRRVDQIAFFDRENGKNTITTFYNDGKLTGEELPPQILERLRIDKKFISLYNKYFHKNIEVKVDKDMKRVMADEEDQEVKSMDDILNAEYEKDYSLPEDDTPKVEHYNPTEDAYNEMINNEERLEELEEEVNRKPDKKKDLLDSLDTFNGDPAVDSLFVLGDDDDNLDSSGKEASSYFGGLDDVEDNEVSENSFIETGIKDVAKIATGHYEDVEELSVEDIQNSGNTEELSIDSAINKIKNKRKRKKKEASSLFALDDVSSTGSEASQPVLSDIPHEYDESDFSLDDSSSLFVLDNDSDGIGG